MVFTESIMEKRVRKWLHERSITMQQGQWKHWQVIFLYSKDNMETMKNREIESFLDKQNLPRLPEMGRLVRLDFTK